MATNAPAILNVLRVCDIPQVLGMLAPRPLTLLNGSADLGREVSTIYSAAEAADRLVLR